MAGPVPQIPRLAGRRTIRGYVPLVPAVPALGSSGLGTTRTDEPTDAVEQP